MTYFVGLSSLPVEYCYCYKFWHYRRVHCISYWQRQWIIRTDKQNCFWNQLR